MANDPSPPPPAAPAALLEEVCALRSTIVEEAVHLLVRWRNGGDRSLGSAAPNLAAYLALRHHDVRPLQAALADLGLSSLGRSEGHVLATLDAVIGGLGRMTGGSPAVGGVQHAADTAQCELDLHMSALFGRPLGRRHTRIMVTLDGRDARNPERIHALVASGMDCARINCGHDDPTVWAALAGHVRDAARATSRQCTVLMDLSGPRLRVGPITPGPPVVHAGVRRDELGRVLEPAVVVLDGSGAPGASGDRGPDGNRQPARVAVDPDWLALLAEGGRVELVDGGGRRRRLEVIQRRSPTEVVCQAPAGCYIPAGQELRYLPPKGSTGSTVDDLAAGHTTMAGSVLPRPARIHVAAGDRILLSRTAPTGRPPTDERPATITCEAPQVLDDLEVGHRVLIDDGRIEAVVRSTDEIGALLEVVTAPRGATIKPQKGLNLPDTDLGMPSLTAADLEALDSVVTHADAVGYSFVRTAGDLDALGDELDRRGGQHLAVLAKIETRAAVHNLPELLARGPARRPFGVMIARGDLAIEIGYERLAEVQEEILLLGEAAHVPVVWATQVLDTMVKTGHPTRAEITDAAASDRAECVMLNKGPFQVDAVVLLHDLLRRMHPLHAKSTSLLPALDLTLDRVP